ncbi:protein NipSnap homolog 3A [Dunckerocampus dactyliophorus]|uniref:protein NipSnap homolog 3A n=1 Tax=Dunckerocampus dactyliophorus TaxID=161453 RepID=UPI0024062BC1|nr:protein NipSnap homolog 3A [Dunckerocampus dactyliophorus]
MWSEKIFECLTELTFCWIFTRVFTFNMIQFSSCTRRLARVIPAPRAHLSTGSQHSERPLYEFRTYRIHPDRTAAFLKLTNEKIHLRTAHSELIGYWSVEYGGLNQVFHIWKYDSFSQRAAVRSALAQDPCWLSEYISKAIPMLTSQDNEVTSLLPWSRLHAPPQEGGAFELASFKMRPGGAALWGRDLQDAITSHDAPGHAHLVAAFRSELGHLDTVHALWWFESADKQRQIQRDAAVPHVDTWKNKLMFPCSFSPLK